MISIEEMEMLLDEIAAEFPAEFYNRLNGGIILLPQAKLHQKSESDDLYILGEYFRDRNLGKYIAVYYGSFEKVYGYLSKEKMKERLRETLKHEFRHHLETMAGERELEKEDALHIAKYLRDGSGKQLP
ncbi:MAG: metallopeptidase family protein [Christensenellales bacterium]